MVNVNNILYNVPTYIWRIYGVVIHKVDVDTHNLHMKNV